MSSPVIYSPIGILGGGQLGKMLAQAGADWNLDLEVLDPIPTCPASSCAKQKLGDFRDYDTVVEFGLTKSLITIEIEDVNLAALEYISNQGIEVHPSPQVLKIIQDKGIQKQFYQTHGFPTSNFELFSNREEIIDGIEGKRLSYPFVQKLRTAGYDGKGVQIIKNQNDLGHLFDAPSVVEEKINISKEIAVLAARNTNGEVIAYDPVEMVFHPEANLLLYQECPASINDFIAKRAKELATQLIDQLKLTGLLAVEFFIDHAGNLLINEVAPRPHNSGHHTIEASLTSQFQQHWRCILGLPLGSPDLRASSILINLLGEPGFSGTAQYQGLESSLATTGVFIHLYGKKETKPYRKMGHITIIGEDMKELKLKAQEVQNNLKVIS